MDLIISQLQTARQKIQEATAKLSASLNSGLRPNITEVAGSDIRPSATLEYTGISDRTSHSNGSNLSEIRTESPKVVGCFPYPEKLALDDILEFETSPYTVDGVLKPESLPLDTTDAVKD